MAKAPASKAEEKAEAPRERTLSAIGTKTLAGYRSRFGEQKGEAKFWQALENGALDADKMLKVAPKEPDADDAEPATGPTPFGGQRRHAKGMFQARSD